MVMPLNNARSNFENQLPNPLPPFKMSCQLQSLQKSPLKLSNYSIKRSVRV